MPKRGRKPIEGVGTHFICPNDLYDYLCHYARKSCGNNCSEALRVILEQHRAQNMDGKLTLKSS